MKAERALNDILADAFVRCRSVDASLGERLQAFADEVRRAGPQFAVTVDRVVNHLAKNGVGAAAPNVGEPLPAFMLPNEEGHLVHLDNLLSEGPIAVSFHRGQWCPYCRINVDALARAEQELAAERRHITAIVPDRQRFAMWLKSDANAPFPILTDMDNGYAMSLGLAISVGDEMKEMMISSGWDPSVSQGTDNWMLPIPATFVVASDGTIRARFIDPDYRKRIAIEDLVAALRSAS